MHFLKIYTYIFQLLQHAYDTFMILNNKVVNYLNQQ